MARPIRSSLAGRSAARRPSNFPSRPSEMRWAVTGRASEISNSTAGSCWRHRGAQTSQYCRYMERTRIEDHEGDVGQDGGDRHRGYLNGGERQKGGHKEAGAENGTASDLGAEFARTIELGQQEKTSMSEKERREADQQRQHEQL